MTVEKPNKPELLAPAGSLAALRAAVAAGADAVYFGGQAFSARANAKNFTRDELCYAIAYCREHGVKTNITANTLVFDRELDEWLRYAEFLYQAGADAMIVADLGAAVELRRRIPDFALHASTQAGVADLGAAMLCAELGFSRVVLARELSAADIRAVTAHCGVETEMFLHGALCVSASGQCLFSSVVGGRSGNRGECAQPCRLPYNGATPLSLKDSCLAAHIPEILTLGVSSLKIEGRMKPPEYVYGVTSIYRRLIDENRAATGAEIAHLAALFSRSGFTDAYFTAADRAGMLGVRTESDKRDSAELTVPKSLHLDGAATPVPFPVRPLPATAGTPLALPREKAATSGTHLRFLTPESMRALPPVGERETRYLPLEEFLACDPAAVGCVGVTLPPVTFESEREETERRLAKAVEKGARAVACDSLAALAMARKYKEIAVLAGYRQNAANALTVGVLKRLGAATVTASAELTVPQARDVNRAAPCAVFGYGNLSLMTLTRCLLKQAVGCDKCKRNVRGVRYALTDRRGVSFPVLPLAGHRNLILNSLPTYLGKKEKEALGVGSYLLDFTTESAQTCADVLARFKKNEDLNVPVRRAGMRKPDAKTGDRERNHDGKSVRNRYGKLVHENVREGNGRCAPRTERRHGR